MNNRTAMGVCIAVLFTIILLAFTLQVFGARPGIKAADRPPSPAPIPSTPDTALPIISTEPPTTTLPPETTTTTRPTPTTTTEEPPAEPDVQGRSESITNADPSDAEMNTVLIQIGACEQPDPTFTQPYGINWKHRGPTYQGGLGLWYGTWQANRPEGAPANAGDATIDQQLAAGRNIARRYGWKAWGCAARLGLS